MRKFIAVASLLVAVNANAQRVACPTGDILVGSTCVANTAVAPEIDPASAASGITLLLAAVAIIRGRRVRNKPA